MPCRWSRKLTTPLQILLLKPRPLRNLRLLPDFAKQMGNIAVLLISIGAIVFFTLLLVTGNTMAIAVRERTPELAILKALGYSNRFILVYVLAESLSHRDDGRDSRNWLGENYLRWAAIRCPAMLPLFYLPLIASGIGNHFAAGDWHAGRIDSRDYRQPVCESLTRCEKFRKGLTEGF